jgi:hypothetical protein
MSEPLISDDDFAAAAADPVSAASDGESATARSADDLIKLDTYVRGRRVLAEPSDAGGPRSAWGCIRQARVRPPGTV